MPTHAHCPRCDYDLSGETSRWESQCPLHGRCPECGLDFAWTHVCMPERWMLRGFVEQAKGLRWLFLWAWCTWSWTVLPWRFWNRVEMHHKVSVPKILFWLVAVVFLPHLLCTSLVTGAEMLAGVRTRTSGWGWLNDLTDTLVQFDGPWSGVPVVRWTFSEWPTQATWLIVGVFGLPILLGLMPISLRRAKVRPQHIFRASVYSTAIPGMFYALNGASRFGFDCLAHFNAYNPTTWNTFAKINQIIFDSFFAFAGLWLALWWLLALTLGWKLRHGWVVWISIVVIAGLIATAYGGFEFTLLGRIYRF